MRFAGAGETLDMESLEASGRNNELLEWFSLIGISI